METRPPSLWARVFATVGLGARLPKPTGPHLVRSFIHRITGEHGVLGQVFFPVKLVEQEAGLPSSKQTTAIITRRAYRNGVLTGSSYFSSMPKWLFGLLLGAAPHPLSEVPPNTRIISQTGDGAHSLPLILFSHGLGGNCEVYSKFCSDLASHGFIVVALEHEDGSGSYAKTVDGDVVKYLKPPQGMPYVRENVIAFREPFLLKREKEIRRAVEYFTTERDYTALEKTELAYREDLIHCLQSISADKVFLSGHSFGAASTVHTVRSWPGRFQGAILMDIWSFPIPDIDAGLKDIPVCSILSENFATNGEAILTWRLLDNSNKRLCSVYLPGSSHSSFSDAPWWAPKWVGIRFGLRGTLAPELTQETFTKVYVTFLQHVLSESDKNENESKTFEERLLESEPLLKPFTKPY